MSIHISPYLPQAEPQLLSLKQAFPAHDLVLVGQAADAASRTRQSAVRSDRCTRWIKAMPEQPA